MRNLMKPFFCALAIAALASISASAKDKDKVDKKIVTLPEPTMVNGTLLKAGQYEAKFDENTNELRLFKDGKVRATTLAHLEARSGKARETSVTLLHKGSEAAELREVTFHGWDRDVVVNASGSMSGASQ